MDAAIAAVMTAFYCIYIYKNFTVRTWEVVCLCIIVGFLHFLCGLPAYVIGVFVLMVYTLFKVCIGDFDWFEDYYKEAREEERKNKKKK